MPLILLAQPKIEDPTPTYLTKLQHISASQNLPSPLTFTGVGFGSIVARPNVRSIFCILRIANAATGGALSSATIGGVSANIVYQNNVTYSGGWATRYAVFYADIPSGTSGDIVINSNFTGTPTFGVFLDIAVYRLINYDCTTYTERKVGAGTPPNNFASATIDVAANGAVLGDGYLRYVGGGSFTLAFSNLSTVNTTGPTSPNVSTYAMQEFTSLQTVSTSLSTNGSASTNINALNYLLYSVPPLSI